MGADFCPPFFTMALTKQDILNDFASLQLELGVADVSVEIGSTSGVKGSKGTVENDNTLDPEGLTNGYDFSVWVAANSFANETLTPLRTVVKVDGVDYVLLKLMPLPSGVIERLDLKNKGRR